MRTLTILCLIALVYSKKNKDSKPKCDGVHVHGKFHKKEVLTNGLNRPYQLSTYNHTVFFSSNVGDKEKDTFEIAYVTKGQKVPTAINATRNGFATAVDEKDKVAYFGGSEGIYVHDLTRHGEIKHVEHVVKGHDIWDMFFKHHLYFIIYPSQRLHKKVGNSSELVDHIHEKVFQYVIDGDDDTFITTKNGLYEIKNGTNGRILYEGPEVFRAVEVNRKGVAHFCGRDAIYIAHKHNHTLQEIAHIDNIFGLTFDNEDNIIYSDPHQIVKLLPGDCK